MMTTDAPMSLERPAILEIDGLVKTYGNKRVVDGLSLQVGRGEIFGILGGNGAGKTTSVECAQGLRRADSGTVRVLGCDPIADRGQLRGRIGSQLQDASLPDRQKVRETVALFADDRTQALVAMDDWDLGPIAKTAFGDLSGGQRQRLFLALALLNKPEVVFLDELTQGLDPTARRAVWELIDRVRDQGTTVVLVTHFAEEAEVLCDRVGVVVNGKIADHGTPAELIERHSDGIRMRFTAPAGDQQWISALPGVSSVTSHGTELEVRGASLLIAHVGAGLVARDRVPTNIRVDQPDLEQALIKLIKTEVSS